MKILILISTICFTGAFGFIEFNHPCRDVVTPKDNFSPAFYTGIWFENLHSSYGDDNDLVQCVEHRYTRRGLQHEFDVERVGVLRRNFVREAGITRLAFPNETPLRALFNGTIDRIIGGTVDYTYRIYATDYTSYAISWSCTELPNSRSREEISVLGRSTQLTEPVYLKVADFLASIGLVNHNLRHILHSDEWCLLN